MNLLNIAAKSAGILATGSVLIDSNDIGVRNAIKKSRAASSDEFISDTVGASKLGYNSEQYGATKNFFRRFRLSDRTTEILSGIGGYFGGLGNGLMHNLPTLGFSALAVFSKSKLARKIGIIGTGLSVAANFVMYGTNFMEKTDYLKK